MRNDKIISPGLLNSHYSPTKPLYFIDDSITELPSRSGIILHNSTQNKLNAQVVIYTSEDGNLLETAASLFKSLHRMEDNPTVLQIFIEKVAEEGIGIAIMDRLKKATFQYNR